jgi:hypothetical protein
MRHKQVFLKVLDPIPISHGIIPKQLNNITSHEREISERCDTTLLICHGIPSMVAQLF